MTPIATFGSRRSSGWVRATIRACRSSFSISSTGEPMRVSRVCLLLAALPGTLVGQSLAGRIQSVREGTVRFTYASRPGLCGDGRDAVRSGPVMVVLPSVVSYGHSDIDVCLTGPVRVAIGRSGGESVSYRVHVGGRWNDNDDASNLGVVSAPEAARYLLDEAQRANGNNSVYALAAAV